jgi:hypothetical protein
MMRVPQWNTRKVCVTATKGYLVLNRRACLNLFGMANGKSFDGKKFNITKVLVGI